MTPLGTGDEPLSVRIGKLRAVETKRRRIILDVPRKSSDTDSVYLNVRAHGRGPVGWITAVVRDELYAFRFRPGSPTEVVHGA